MAKKEKAPAVVAVQIQVEPSPGTATYYVNHLEISHSQHDFVLTGSRVPSKLSAAKQAEILKSKSLLLEAEVQLTLPPTLLRPLIAALEKQLDAYERTIGKITVQKGAPNAKP